MPWCPKCKNEYKEGYTVCADCGAQLVDSLDHVKVQICAGAEDKLQDISKFLNANGITDIDIIYVEEHDAYALMIPESKVKVVEKIIRVYMMNVEQAKMQEPVFTKEKPWGDKGYIPVENMEPVIEEENNTDDEIAVAMPSREFYKGAYREVGKKAEEYKSGADTLIFVGVLGIVALVLLHLGILPIALTATNKVMITLVMGVLFIIFIIMGISSHKSYRELKQAEGGEQDTKAEIGNFLKENIHVASFDAGLSEDDPTMEILYFRRIERMKAMILEKYPNLDSSFMDYIIEETYAEIFE